MIRRIILLEKNIIIEINSLYIGPKVFEFVQIFTQLSIRLVWVDQKTQAMLLN